VVAVLLRLVRHAAAVAGIALGILSFAAVAAAGLCQVDVAAAVLNQSVAVAAYLLILFPVVAEQATISAFASAVEVELLVDVVIPSVSAVAADEQEISAVAAVQEISAVAAGQEISAAGPEKPTAATGYSTAVELSAAQLVCSVGLLAVCWPEAE